MFERFESRGTSRFPASVSRAEVRRGREEDGEVLVVTRWQSGLRCAARGAAYCRLALGADILIVK